MAPVPAIAVAAIPVCVFRGRGAGVGGGVHGGGEGFELFGGGEDFQVVQAVFGAADEGALDLAERGFGGFGAVLVDRLGPVPGDARDEVGVIVDRRLSEFVFHRGGAGGGGEVPGPVQGEGDRGRGTGADLGGADRRREFPVAGR